MLSQSDREVGALALPVTEEHLLVAREGVVGAVVVMRLEDVEGLRTDLDLVRMCEGEG